MKHKNYGGITDNNANSESEHKEKFKNVSALHQWKISCINNYGDVVVAGSSLGGKIFVFRLDTDIKKRSCPQKLPVFLTPQILSFGDLSPNLPSGVLCCNVWHMAGSQGWDWQTINIIHQTGTIYR